jgi:N-sulfoglucosamine sulfohydrolase
MAQQKPNIIYINSHDTGRYISPYGFRVRTPNLQKLAEDGVLFRQSFSAAPTCSPSRASLCTGMYPHSCGMIGLGNRGIYPFDLSKHLAHTLKNNGYETIGADNHMGIGNIKATARDIGYEKDLGWNATDAAVDYIKQPHEKPFFMSLSYVLTHRIGDGFGAELDEKEDDPRYVLTPATLADTPEIRRDWAHFLSTAYALDIEMGKVFDAVEKAGIKDNTLIIATTDHGVAFPSMKCNLTVHGVGVFLIMCGPEGFNVGKVIDSLVSQVDIFPTICDLTGIEKPDWLEGQSLVGLVNGKQTEVHDEIFAEVTYHAAYEPMRSIRTKRYVYIQRLGARRRPVLANCDRSPSKDAWMQHGFSEMRLPDEMLFDTFFDPQEMNNLAFNPQYEHVLLEMRERLLDWMELTNDPLLDGKVPMQETGWENLQEVNDPDNSRRPKFG